MQSRARHCKARQVHLKDDVRLAIVQDALSLSIIRRHLALLGLSFEGLYRFSEDIVNKVLGMGWLGLDFGLRKNGELGLPVLSYGYSGEFWE